MMRTSTGRRAGTKKMPNVTYGSVEVRPLSIHEQDD
jgi:hypothetical protein